MFEFYIYGVLASLIFVIATLIKDKFWEDLEDCVSKEQAIGMCIGIFLGFFVYSLFSWVAFCDMFYNEYFRQS